MRLALALGCTLDDLSQRMTGAEFGLWLAYYERDPFGDARGDLQAGIVAAAVANYAGKTRSAGSGPASPAEFMPFMDSDEPTEQAEPDPVAFFSSIKAS
jgi:hypothetical protein